MQEGNTDRVSQLDLHGYHPDEIVGGDVLYRIVQQAWEMGKTELRLIHGHGRKPRPFTGFRKH
jgi:DNA-nicking Smr family endonuclease